jgi:hypothetical protein
MSAPNAPRLVKEFLIACTAGLVALASISSKADLLVGISFPSLAGGDKDVVGFDTGNPGTTLFDHPIIGLAGSS